MVRDKASRIALVNFMSKDRKTIAQEDLVREVPT
jgi:hypothetical protein